MNKKESSPHQYQHDSLHRALKVGVTKHPNTDEVYAYHDVDAPQYNLFRGQDLGEGHSDRLLDDYLARKTDLKVCNACERYKTYLGKQKLHGDKAVPMSVRSRLYKSL